MDFRETGYEDGRWMELAKDRVQWQALVLAFCYQRINFSRGRDSLIERCRYNSAGKRQMYPYAQLSPTPGRVRRL
jgi:hypothetical protein